MAEGLNKVILIGNLGADPELKYTAGSNQAVAKLRLATTESYQTKTGERQQRTAWHSVVVWGKRAEALSKILSKGRTICVEGRIDYQQWDDKDGNKRYKTEIVATDVILLGGGQAGGGGARREGGGYGGGEDFGGGGAGGGGGGGEFPPDDFADDDIPF
jgi:single-strand DNA-binding protein